MHIALIAHDNMKDTIVQIAREFKSTLVSHTHDGNRHDRRTIAR